MAGELNDAVQEEIPMEANTTTPAKKPAPTSQRTARHRFDSQLSHLRPEPVPARRPHLRTRVHPEAETPASSNPRRHPHASSRRRSEDEPPAVLNESAADEDESAAE